MTHLSEKVRVGRSSTCGCPIRHSFTLASCLAAPDRIEVRLLPQFGQLTANGDTGSQGAEAEDAGADQPFEKSFDRDELVAYRKRLSSDIARAVHVGYPRSDGARPIVATPLRRITTHAHAPRQLTQLRRDAFFDRRRDQPADDHDDQEAEDLWYLIAEKNRAIAAASDVIMATLHSVKPHRLEVGRGSS